MEYRAIRKDDELYHYGVKGMKWGVRRYQNTDGSLTVKGKKRYSDVGDGPTVSTKNTTYGTRRQLDYINKSNTDDKKALDKMAQDNNYLDADRKFDYEFTKYAKNCREKGEEYADKVLHDSLKNYSYTFIKDTETWGEGEEYAIYTLKVTGNKNFYETFGDEYYSDDQRFGTVNKKD